MYIIYMIYMLNIWLITSNNFPALYICEIQIYDKAVLHQKDIEHLISDSVDELRKHSIHNLIRVDAPPGAPWGGGAHKVQYSHWYPNDTMTDCH